VDRRVSTTVDAYRIEKDRLDVTLTLVGGEELHGHIFVSPPAIGHTGSDEPSALFNNDEPFFPLELDSGEMLLIAKAQVLEISGLPLGDDDELLRASSPMALLQLTLAGGISHFGSMRLEVRADRPRLLDHLNESTQRFLALYTDNGVRLINRMLIESVRPLD
jgi:hypothetical protein